MKLSFVATVFFSIPSALAQGNFLRGGSDNSEAPLDLNAVVESVANHIWNDEANDKTNAPAFFVIKGSYPAAIKALEHNPALLLPYNDIDILLPWTDPACKPGSFRRTHTTTLIPNQHVHLIEECGLSQNDIKPNNIRVAGDINAVGVAITVDASRKMLWEMSEEFQEFLLTRILTMNYHDESAWAKNTGPAHSVVRLFKKAEQSRLDYKVDPATREMLHGAVFSKQYKNSIDSLSGAYQDAFYSIFDVLPTSNGYALALKGLQLPSGTMERRLECEYDDDPDCNGGDHPVPPPPKPSPRPPKCPPSGPCRGV